jgi:hypothetical protein
MSEPNSWLPDATGRAPANDYDYTGQNGQGGSGSNAQQAARMIAMTTARYAARRYGPKLAKGMAAALRGLIR